MLSAWFGFPVSVITAESRILLNGSSGNRRTSFVYKIDSDSEERIVIGVFSGSQDIRRP